MRSYDGNVVSRTLSIVRIDSTQQWALCHQGRVSWKHVLSDYLSTAPRTHTSRSTIAVEGIVAPLLDCKYWLWMSCRVPLDACCHSTPPYIVGACIGFAASRYVSRSFSRPCFLQKRHYVWLSNKNMNFENYWNICSFVADCKYVRRHDWDWLC